MTIGGGFAVDGITQLQAGFDKIGTHIEQFRDLFSDLSVGQLHFGRAIGIDVDAGGLCYADSVGNLYQDLVGYTGRNQVLGDMAGSIGRGAVDLGGSFPLKAPPPCAPLPP